MTPLYGSETLYGNSPYGKFSELATWDYTLPGVRQVEDFVCVPVYIVKGLLNGYTFESVE